MLDWTRFEALTFDCYGTLIDWERGILEAARPLLRRHGVACDDERLLAAYAAAESAAERPPFRAYRQVLREVVDGIGAALGFRPDAADREALVESLPRWPPFPDTVEALQELRRRHRLAIVSNVDDDLFAGTARLLDVEFDAIVTAQQVGSYKPAPGHFRRALERLALPKEKVLHVAQSLYHDVAPARALGWATVWVNRRSGRPGPGATPPADARADIEVPNMRTLADLLLMERRPGTP